MNKRLLSPTFPVLLALLGVLAPTISPAHAQEQAEQAQQQAEQAQQQTEQQTEKITSQQDKLDTLTAQMAELEQQNAALQQSISEYQKTGDDQATELLAQQQQLEVQRKQIEDQIAQVTQQQKQIAEQDQRLKDQDQRIKELNDLVLSLNNRLLALTDQMPDSTVTAAWQQRLDRLETSVDELPEVPTDVVEAGEFPGSFTIPGTDAALKISGRIKTNLVYNLDALLVDDRFLTAAIPIAGTEEAGKGPRLTLSARASRFSLDFRTPTGVGAMRGFIEGDFAGDGNTFRLRHAYGQYGDLLVGKTWSNLVDLHAVPEELDFEGLNAKIQLRQTQIRYTKIWKNGWNLAASAENPSPEITGAAGVSLAPDLIVKTYFDFDDFHDFHARVGILARQIIGESDANPNENLHVGGFGITAGGNLPSPWAEKDNFVFQATYGQAIGHYITDLRAVGGQDAVYDSTTNTMQALPVFATYAAYKHYWHGTLRSTFCAGYVNVYNLEIQSDSAYHRTLRLNINLIYSPVSRLDLGVEYLWGRRVNKDKQYGKANQIQLATIFRF